MSWVSREDRLKNFESSLTFTTKLLGNLEQSKRIIKDRYQYLPSLLCGALIKYESNRGTYMNAYIFIDICTHLKNNSTECTLKILMMCVAKLVPSPSTKTT